MTTSNLIAVLNLHQYPAKEQEELLIALGNAAFRGTLARLIQKMNEKARVDFSALLARNASPEEVDTFLKERVQGAEEATADTLSDLASDLKAAGVY
ncbi:hypothetical protein A3E65_02350 [Candidatus Kaiserbacteria bacterium RIFCSPHIGHO2_12_FULL_56_13]|uniref:Uncharacterized protein n=1 Tax=Candidatus Kaiserbacteria bacterium RIFCSPHIGHO2_12_FULL_56_13 TaxID=1798505 RepID=A0A1F6EFB9_9BACT|nr:MAG: hypothetical protein A3E65_02350 [Candidatus Kaiserbacteria bacterium RIFCSPHIGHO2_12_FULL_56_13]